jgi:hypothetical protein
MRDYPNIEKALPGQTMALIKEIVRSVKAGDVRNPHAAKRLISQSIKVKKILDSMKENTDGKAEGDRPVDREDQGEQVVVHKRHR